MIIKGVVSQMYEPAPKFFSCFSDLFISVILPRNKIQKLRMIARNV